MLIDPRGSTPLSWPVVITIFTRGVLSFRPRFFKSRKTKQLSRENIDRYRRTVGLAEWIIDCNTYHFTFE